MRLHNIAPALSLGCLLALALPALADDIILRSGDAKNGVTVMSESLAEVVYQEKGGAKGSIKPGTKVRLIIRDNMTESLDNALSFLGAGKYQSAIDEFNVVTSTSQGWQVEYAYHGLGRAKMMLGMKGDKGALSEAVLAFEKVIETNSSSRFAVEVQLYKGICKRLQKDFDGAIAAYSAAKTTAGSVGDGWPERAGCGVGWSQLEKGDANAALSTFEGVVGSARSHPEVYREALSGWCEAAAKAGRAKDIEGKIASMKGSKDRATLAVFHNGMGRIKFAEKEYADARAEFVKVVALYYADPNEHARALYFAGRCYEALGEGDYARTYRAELRSRYPLSTWALLAR